MSVLIKNMKMPENCFICRYVCTMHYSKKWRHKRHPDCPLAEVPPHGRLIDADALYRRVKTECNPYGKPTINFDDGNKVMDMIDDAPTVIEAEEG